MACLSGEQLAALALGLDEAGPLAAHVQQCEACRAKLADTMRLTERLSAVHAHADRTHAASRSRLLAGVSNFELSARTVPQPGRLARTLRDLSLKQRIAAGGIGLSTAVGLLLLILIVANSATSLSAMERMAQQLREVTSYSYKLFTLDKFIQEGETQPTTVIHTGTTYWRAPGSLFYEENLDRTAGPRLSNENEGGQLGRLAGIHPAGQPGLMIYHAGRVKSMEHTYWRVPEVRPDDLGLESPITRLRMVREGEGEVLRELGTKMIDGREARGYVMSLQDAPPNSGFDALEVWVDPETELPVEFGYEVKGDYAKRTFRITDCRWNIEIDPKWFDTTPPVGYTDISPPTDKEAIAQIAAALKLYAELSGGHYPQGTFDAEAIQHEMLKLAGFTGSPRDEWNDNPRLREIQEAAAGLTWIERVLRHQYGAGYHGDTVGPNDKDKVLLWWTIDAQDRTHVFYGDLRTGVLIEKVWAKLVPAEVAESR